MKLAGSLPGQPSIQSQGHPAQGAALAILRDPTIPLRHTTLKATRAMLYSRKALPEHEDIKVQRLQAAVVFHQRCQPILSPAERGVVNIVPGSLWLARPCRQENAPLLFVHCLYIDVGCSLLFGLGFGKIR